MTTNKKKVGTHYYESANVKNKNRKSAEVRATMKAAMIGERGSRKATSKRGGRR